MPRRVGMFTSDEKVRLRSPIVASLVTEATHEKILIWLSQPFCTTPSRTSKFP
jgi:hypothetical protein